MDINQRTNILTTKMAKNLHEHVDGTSIVSKYSCVQYNVMIILMMKTSVQFEISIVSYDPPVVPGHRDNQCAK